MVYERRHAAAISLPEHGHPRPAFFTISENLYRRRIHPQAKILAIATFCAGVTRQPRLGDLYGLLCVPREALSQVFASGETPWSDLGQLAGVRALTRTPLPERAILVPVWTGRSLQCLVQSGRVPGCVRPWAEPPAGCGLFPQALP